jgi:syntaxin 5
MSVVHPAEKSRLLASASEGQQISKSDFSRAAAAIAKDISGTAAKLGRLTALARKKSLFDDRPMEINELIYIIKQDIAKVNRNIAQLSEFLGRASSNASSANTTPLNNVQAAEHSRQVLSSLQTRLALTSGDFKDILELRTANMKEQKNRREVYAASGDFNNGPAAAFPIASSSSQGSTALSLGPSSDSPLYHPDRRAGFTHHDPNSPTTVQQTDTIIDLGGLELQQQSLVSSNTQATMEYMDSRSQAIDSIESTIAELGQIYQNFASLLTQQREMVQRIDDNVLEMQTNVEGAHAQLAKYYQSISSNRALMLKVFGVLIVFIMLFVLMT